MENLQDLGSTTWMCKLPTVDGLDSPLMPTTRKKSNRTDDNTCDLTDDENEMGIIDFDQLDINFDDLNIENDVMLVKEHIKNSKKPVSTAHKSSCKNAELDCGASALQCPESTFEQIEHLNNTFTKANTAAEVDLTEDQEKELFMQAQAVLRLIKNKSVIGINSSKVQSVKGTTAKSTDPPVNSGGYLAEIDQTRPRSNTFTKDDKLRKPALDSVDSSNGTEKRQRKGTFVNDEDDLPAVEGSTASSDCEAGSTNEDFVQRQRTGTFVKDNEFLCKLHTPVNTHTTSLTSASKLTLPQINIDFSPTHSPILPRDANGVVKFQGSPSTSPSGGAKVPSRLSRSATFKKPQRPSLSKLQAPRVSSTVSGPPQKQSSYSSSTLPQAKTALNTKKHQRSRSNRSDTSDASNESTQSSASSTASSSLLYQPDSRLGQLRNLSFKSGRTSSLVAPKKKSNVYTDCALTSASSLNQSATATTSQVEKACAPSGPSTCSSKKVSSFVPNMLSKMSMLKPSLLQRRVLTANRNKQTKAATSTTGPMKATGSLKPPSTTITHKSLNAVAQTTAAIQDKPMDKSKKAEQKPSGLMKRSGSFLKGLPRSSSNKVSGAAAKDVCGKVEKTPSPSCEPTLPTTPVQKEKNVQPKRILLGPENTTPTKKNEGKASGPGEKTPKRRSFLPTPTKKKPNKYEIDDGCHSNNHSSMSSVDSPVGTELPNLAVGILIDLNGIEDLSPSCMKSKASRVIHTPMNKENEYEQSKSAWSPISRPSLSREDQAFMCTKRGIPR